MQEVSRISFKKLQHPTRASARENRESRENRENRENRVNFM